MMKTLSKNDCYYIAYNHKYVVLLGDRNAVYSRHDWTKITTFTVYQCTFGLFLSDDELLVKTTSGRYFIYNILEETKIFFKPRGSVNPDSIPFVDLDRAVIYDIVNKRDGWSLLKFDFNGKSQEVLKLPFGLYQNLGWRNNSIVMAVSVWKKADPITWKSEGYQIRKFIFDTKTDQLLDKKELLVQESDAYLDQNMILYTDGRMTDYNGILLKVLFQSEKAGLRFPKSGWSKFEHLIDGKLYCRNTNHLEFIDLWDETFYKSIPIDYAYHVVILDNDILIAHNNGVTMIENGADFQF